MRKGRGKEAKLSFAEHALTENRNGLVKDLQVTEANGRCEREAALEMVKAHVAPGSTIGADSAYNTKDFVAKCRERGVTPHVAGKKEHSAIDARTTTPGLRSEPKGPQEDRAGARMAEDHRRAPQVAVQGPAEDAALCIHGWRRG